MNATPRAKTSPSSVRKAGSDKKVAAAKSGSASAGPSTARQTQPKAAAPSSSRAKAAAPAVAKHRAASKVPEAKSGVAKVEASPKRAASPRGKPPAVKPLAVKAPQVGATARTAQQAKADAVAKAKAVAPDVVARLGSTPQTKYRGNADIFGRLVEDHDRHRALLAMLDETRGKSPDRQRLFKALVLEIKAHAAAEEQALWSSVMRHPDTTEDARHAVGEHKEMDRMLADLAARDMAKPAWLKRFSAVRDEYLHHIREEEQEQFLAAEKILSTSDLRHLRQVFNVRKQAEKSAVKVEKKIRLKG